MPDPIKYDRSTWENQKRLLKAYDDRQNAKDDWKAMGLFALGIGGAVLFVVCVVGFFIAMFLR